MTSRWLIALGSLAFAAAYGQAALFYSNQNQYLLHGYAAAGDGYLANDWLVQTADPTPVFSGFVAIVVRFAHPWFFHVAHAVLLAIYAASLVAVFLALVPSDEIKARWPWFLLLLTLLHSAALRWASYRLLGQDYPYYFQAGLAGQYVLGAMFQPSVFGVLLLAAVACFLFDRFVAAALFVAAAATIHSTYVLPGAMLTAGFLASLARDRRGRDAMVLAGVALAATLPVVLFVAWRFTPTSPETFAAAQDLLANVRIPHHCRVDQWLDPVAWGQIAWIGLATLVAWRTRMFAVLAVPFVLAAILTAIQAATGNPSLALLFPWRISVILVPLATTIFLGRLVAWIRLPNVAVCPALAAFAFAGVFISVGRHAFRTNDDENALYEFVRTSRQPGDCYLVPVRLPKASTRGSFSSDFKPLAEKKTDTKIIPLDLQRFRLMTGTPIYVDFKSIPYRDVDVVEWRRRLERAQEWMTNPDVNEMSREGITHVVVPAGKELLPPFRRVHQDEAYQVYRMP